jgi:hypothetical protein
MNLKRLVPAVLVLLSVVPFASATAYHTPIWGADYTCDYTNPPSPRIDGLSIFVLQSTQYDSLSRPIYRTIEYFDATYGIDNNKMTFAKPVNTVIGTYVVKTRWEATLLNGPQCTQTDVYNWGGTIVFAGCSDGHTRTCERLY